MQAHAPEANTVQAIETLSKMQLGYVTGEKKERMRDILKKRQ